MSELVPGNPALSSRETDDFRLVVESARAEQWLEADDVVVASPSGNSVNISCSRAGATLRKQYAHDSRWLYQFLCDLALGMWKSEQFAATPGRTCSVLDE